MIRARLVPLAVGVAALVVAHGPRIVHAAEAPPAPTAPRPFNLPVPQVAQLGNGLKATFVAFGTVPKTTVVVSVRAGHLQQGTQPWLPDLLGDLLKEGTTRRSALEISTAAAAMGGELRIGVGDEETTLSLDVLAEQAPEAVRLLAEVLREPLLPETELPRLKQNYLRNLSVIRTQAQAQAGLAFDALLYGNHPFGQGVPTEEQLQGYTHEQLLAFYEANFGAARTHVYVAGRFDQAAMQKAVEDAFADWARGPEPVILPPTAARRLQARLIDRPGAPQSTIRFGVPVISPEQPDFMALSVANTLLGGSITSRITRNLREDKGWAYSPSSSVSARYRDALWTEGADVTTSATGDALVEIVREIQQLQTEPPAESELANVKSYRNGLFVLGNATRGGLIGQLRFMDLHGLPADWLTTFISRLYAITPQQVSAAAREQLRLDETTLVIVGDAAQVRPQLGKVPLLNGVTVE